MHDAYWIGRCRAFEYFSAECVWNLSISGAIHKRCGRCRLDWHDFHFTFLIPGLLYPFGLLCIAILNSGGFRLFIEMLDRIGNYWLIDGTICVLFQNTEYGSDQRPPGDCRGRFASVDRKDTGCWWPSFTVFEL